MARLRLNRLGNRMFINFLQFLVVKIPLSSLNLPGRPLKSTQTPPSVSDSNSNGKLPKSRTQEILATDYPAEDVTLLTKGLQRLTLTNFLLNGTTVKPRNKGIFDFN